MKISKTELEKLEQQINEKLKNQGQKPIFMYYSIGIGYDIQNIDCNKLIQGTSREIYAFFKGILFALEKNSVKQPVDEFENCDFNH
jgi:hypothetical protein